MPGLPSREGRGGPGRNFALLAALSFGAGLALSALLLFGGGDEGGVAPAAPPAPSPPRTAARTAPPAPLPVAALPSAPPPGSAPAPSLPLPAPAPPRPAAEGEAPRPFPPPPGAATPRLAIVVDDLGWSAREDGRWLEFPGTVTFSVLPFGPDSAAVAKGARGKGAEVILHAPMEPKGTARDRTEAFRFTRAMDRAEMAALLDRMLGTVPGASAVSNHMGSAFTSHEPSMALFASLLRERRLAFLDSATSSESAGYRVARAAGLPAGRRRVFLDDAPDPASLAKRWDEALSASSSPGGAVVVCHAREGTRAFLSSRYGDLAARGIRPVPLSALLARGGE